MNKKNDSANQAAEAAQIDSANIDLERLRKLDPLAAGEPIEVAALGDEIIVAQADDVLEEEAEKAAAEAAADAAAAEAAAAEGVAETITVNSAGSGGGLGAAAGTGFGSGLGWAAAGVALAGGAVALSGKDDKAPIVRPNSIPKTQNSSANATEDTQITGQLIATDPDGVQTLSYAFVKEVAGLSLNGDTGVWTFNAADAAYQDLAAGATRTINVGFIATDDAGESSQSTLTLTVTGTNDAPVASADFDGAAEDGGRLFGSVAGNDSDVDVGDTLSYALNTAAPDGFTFRSDGSYDLDTSNAAYQSLNQGEQTTLTIGYTLTDGDGLTSDAILTITVSGTNDAPVAQAVTAAATEETSGTITGNLSASDVDDAALTFAFSGNAPGLSMTNASTGAFSFDSTNAAYNHLAAGETQVLNVAYTVTDGRGATTSSVLSITVTGTNDAPVAVADTASAFEDSLINGSVAGNDSDADSSALTYAVAAPPAGLTFNPDGSYSFNASDAAYQDLDVGDTLDVVVNYTVSDGVAPPVASTLTITVLGTNDGPIASPATASAVEGAAAAVTGTLAATDADADDTITYELASSVPGLTLDAATGAFSFDPSNAEYNELADGEVLEIVVGFTATDSHGAEDSSTLTITVTGTNDAPVAVADVASVSEDSQLTGSVANNDSDVDNTSLTYAVAAPPAGLTFNADGSYSFNAAHADYQALDVGDTQDVVVDYTVSDGTDTVASTLTITVTGTNDTPVAQAATNTATEGGAIVTGSLVATDADADDSTLTYAFDDNYDGLVLDAATGVYSFDPAHTSYNGLSAGQTETIVVGFTATDSQGASTSSTLSITITGTNDAPVAVADVASVSEDSQLSGSVANNDSDVDNTSLTYAVAAPPAGLTFNADGSYSFNAAHADYQALDLGDTQDVVVNYTVSDGTDTVASTLTITVTGTNDGPVAAAATAAGNEGAGAVTGTLAATDVDADDTRTYSIEDTVAGLTLTDPATGAFSFDTSNAAYESLAAGETQTIVVGFTATDSHGAEDSSTLTITVTGTNDAPVAVADVASVSEDSQLSGSVANNDSDVDNTSLTYAVAAPPAGLTFNADGSYSFNAAHADYQALDLGDTQDVVVNYTVSDGTDTVASTLTITVTGTNDGPVAAAATAAGNEGAGAVTGTLAATDVDADDTRTYSIEDTVAGLTLTDPATGAFSFDTSNAAYESLAAGETQTIVVGFTATDSHGAEDSSTLTITVTGTNDAPVAVADVASVSEDSQLSGSVANNDSDVDNTSLTYAVAAPPAGLTFSADGSYVFDATNAAYQALDVGDTQDVVVNYTVSDGTDTVASTLTITVTGTNDGPVAAAATAAGNEGAGAVTGTLAATDVDADDTRTYSIEDTVAGLTLTDPATGAFSFDTSNAAYESLAAGETQTIVVGFTATDSHGAEDSSTLTITVTGTNDAPVAVADVASVSEDSQLSGSVANNDSDVDNTSLTYAVAAPPAGLTFSADGSYVFDATNAAYQALDVGDTQDVVVNYTVSDGTDTVASTLTITVTGTNDGPVAAAATAAGNEGAGAVTGTLAATDVDADDTRTYSIEDTVAGLTLTDPATGAFSFDTSNAAYESLAAGETQTIVVGFTATDSHGAEDSSTLTITVTGTNDAPVAVADVASVSEDSQLSGSVANNDSDVDNTSLTYAVAAPPAGLTFSADGSYVFDATNAAYQALDVGDTQDVVVNYTVSDGTDTVASTLTITVTGTNDGPVAAAATAAGNEGAGAVTGTLAATDVDADDTRTYSIEDTVAGLTLTDPATGAFSFDTSNAAYESLAAGETQTIVVGFTATDSHGAEDSSTLTITVTGTNDAPVAVADVASVSEDSQLSGSVANNDSDVDNTSLTYAVAAPPAGLTFSADGSYVFDASNAAYQALDVGDTQDVVVNYTVSDGTDTVASTLTITVTGTNDGPVAAAATAAATEGAAAVTGTLVATDVDADDTRTYSIEDSVAGLTLTNAATGAFSFDPTNAAYNSLAAGETQTIVVGFTATDSHGAEDSSTLTITVTGTNDAPVAVADVASVSEDSQLSGSVANNDSDVDNTSLTYAVAAPPAGLTFSADGSYVFDATNAAYQALDVGDTQDVVVNYTVSDGTDTVASTLTITVTGTNDGPVAAAATAAATEGAAAVTGTLVATDVDADDTRTYSIEDSVAGLTLTNAATGAFSFDPTNAAYNSLAAGETQTIVVGFTATDSHGAEDSSTLTITVTGTNDAPVAVADVASVSEDSQLSGSVANNDSDVDNTSLTYAVAAPPAGLTFSADGSYVFDATNAAYQALDVGDTQDVVVNYTVSDGTDTVASTLTITVTGTNDGPVAAAATAAATEGAAAVTGTLVATDVDADDTRTYSIEDSVAGLTLTNAATGAFSFDPTNAAYNSLAAGETQTIVVGFTATDSHGAEDSSTLTITVTGTNDAPVAVADVASVSEDSQLSGSVANNDSDVDNTSLTYAVAAPPAGLTFSADGSYVFDATNAAYQALDVGDTQDVVVNYTVSDGTDTVASTLTITVTGTNDGPVAAAATATATEGAGNVTGNLSATDADANDATLTYSFDGSVAGLTQDAVGGAAFTFNSNDAAYQSLSAGQTQVIVVGYTATDSQGAEDHSTLTITITGTNDTPVAVADTASTTEGGAVFSGSIANNDSDADGDTLTYTLGQITLQTQTSGTNTGAAENFNTAGAPLTSQQIADQTGISLSPEGVYTFDPTITEYQDLSGNQSRIATITYTVSDGTASTTSTLTITVAGVNTAVQTAQVTSFDQNGFSVTATDPDLADTLALKPTSTSILETTNGNSNLTNGGAGTHTGTFAVTTTGANPAETVDIAVSDGPTQVDTLHTAFVGSNAGDTVASASDRTFLGYGFAGADTLTGGDKGDVLVGGAGADTLNGGLGDDQLFGDSADALIDGGQDTDTLKVEGANFEDTGDAQIVNTEKAEFVDDNRTISLDQQTEDFTVTAFNGGTSTLTTGSGNYTVISGATGTVNVNANAMAEGNTLTLSGAGNFVVTNLHSTLDATAVTGTVTVTTTDATINTIAISTGTGATSVAGTADGDTITIDSTKIPDDTTLTLTGDSDFTVNNLSGDLAAGGVTVNGNVTVTGLGTDQTITTGAGTDNITGGAGVDTINGGAGDDTINGGAGADVLNGGTGNNTYVFNTGDAATGETVTLDATGTETFSVVTSTDLSALNGGTAALTNLDVISITDSQTATALGAQLTGLTLAVNGAAGGGTETLIVNGTTGNDTIDLSNMTLTNAALIVNGLAGDDTITTTAGNDTVNGDAGDDTIISGAGDDVVNGGDGNDIAQFTIANLTAADTVNGGAHTTFDTLQITDAGTVADAQFTNVSLTEVLTLANGTNTVTLAGLAQAAGIVTVNGGTGADTVDASGYTAAITLNGNGGDDVLTGGSAGDTINGAAGNDTIVGGAGDDTLNGGADNDTITGGAGSDAMDGGTGNNTYVFNTGDVGATETAVLDATGTDTFSVVTTTDFSTLNAGGALTNLDIINMAEAQNATTLGAQVSGLTLAVNGVAGGATETLTVNGTAGDNTINLSGITLTNANMTVNGLAGDDTFQFDIADLTTAVTVVGGAHTTADTLQFLDAGTVNDAQFTNVSTTEVLALANGTNTVTLAGLAQAAGIATVNGGTGADTVDASGYAVAITLNGNGGADVLTGGTAGDTIDGGAGDDAIVGGAGADTLKGGADNDTITGGAGADTMDGGTGNNTYVFNTGDVTAGETATLDATGTDTFSVVTSTDLSAMNGGGLLTNLNVISITDSQTATTLGAQLTGLTLAVNGAAGGGTETLEVNGTAGDDTINLSGITLTNAVMTVDGLAGNDIFQFDIADLTAAVTLIGGAHTTFDTLQFLDAGTITDAQFVNVSTTEVLTLADGVNNATLGANAEVAGIVTVNGGTGADTINASAYSSSITLNGNGDADVLTGGSAADTINGGAGDDTITGGAGADTMDGGTGSNTYVFNTGDVTAGETATLDATGTDTFSVVTSTDLSAMNGGGLLTNLNVISITDSQTATTLGAQLTGLTLAVNGAAGGGTETLEVNGTAGDDTINLSGITLTNAVMTVDGLAGNDIFQFDIADLTAAVTLIGGAHTTFDTLQFLDAGTITDAQFVNVSTTEVLTLADGVNNATLGANAEVAGIVTVNGGTGADTINASAYTSSITLNGNGDADVLTGGSAADTINGGAGDDTIVGGAGDDTLNGGADNDTITGGAGSDAMDGGTGNNTYVFNTGDVGATETATLDVTGTDTFSVVTSTDLSTLNAGGVLTNLDVINITDGQTATALGAQLTGLTLAVNGVAAGGTETLIVNGTAGDDTINLSGVTLTDAVMTVNGGAGAGDAIGNDIFQFSTTNLSSAVTVVGGGHTTFDTLQFTDAGTVVDAQFTNVSTTEVLTLANGTNTITLAAFAEASGIRTVNGGTGADTVDASAYTGAAAITMHGNGGDDVLTGGAAGDTINGGDNNDTISGGAGNDTLNGDAGDDIIISGTGDETITGGTGDDTIRFALADFNATDSVDGGAHTVADTIQLTTAGTVTDALFGGVTNTEVLQLADGTNTVTVAALAQAGGIVTVNGGTGADNVNASAYTTAITISGNGGNDVIVGGIAADTLNGNAGNDTITGGVGADIMSGGADDDVFLIANAADHAAGETIDGGTHGGATDQIRFTNGGTETLALTVGVTNVEGVLISDAAGVTTGTNNANIDASAMLATQNIAITGNDGANMLIGNGGANTIVGGAGSDIITGGAGADTMSGDGGDDVFLISDEGHHVTGESIVGGNGTADVIRFTSTGGQTLVLTNAVDVEEVEISDANGGNAGTTTENIDASAVLSTVVIALTGNEGANVLTGNANINVITAGDGNDTINGGAGVDTLLGQVGDDTFIIALAADHASGETINGGAGTDVIRFTSTAGGTLVLDVAVSNVESAVVSDAAGVATGTSNESIDASAVLNATAINLTGNAGSNTLIGNSANNVITGGANDNASDTLTGGLGSDTFVLNDNQTSAPTAGNYTGLDQTQLDFITDYVVADDTITLIDGGGTTVAVNAITGTFDLGTGNFTAGAGADTLFVNAANDNEVYGVHNGDGI